MANFFDQFDPKPAAGGNFFDQFDPPKATLQRPAPNPTTPPEESGLLRRVVGDSAVDLARGVVGAGEAVVGLANIPTFGGAGKGLEAVGYDPQRTKDMIGDLYSPERKQANQQVADAEGFIDTAAAMIANPSTIAGGIVEAAPSILGGGALARGGATLLRGAVNPVLAAIPRSASGRVVLGAAGEGAIMAGAQAENIRQQTEDGLLTPEQVALSLGTGVVGSGLGVVGGKLANRFGLGDVETLAAGGTTQAVAGEAPKGLLRRGIEGAVVEGAFEEMPQSAAEQALQNLALGNPIEEGVASSAAAGLLTGAALGGVVSAASPAQELADNGPARNVPQPEPTRVLPPSPTTEAALRIRAETAGTPAEREAARSQLAAMMESQGRMIPGPGQTPINVTPEGEARTAAQELGIAQQRAGELRQQADVGLTPDVLAAQQRDPRATLQRFPDARPGSLADAANSIAAASSLTPVTTRDAESNPSAPQSSAEPSPVVPPGIDPQTGEVLPEQGEEAARRAILSQLEMGRVVEPRMIAGATGITPRRASEIRSEIQQQRKAEAKAAAEGRAAPAAAPDQSAPSPSAESGESPQQVQAVTGTAVTAPEAPAQDAQPARPELSVRMGDQEYPVDSVEDASRKFLEIKDRGDIGGMQAVRLIDRNGAEVGFIGQSGEVYDTPLSGIRANPNAQPVYRPPSSGRGEPIEGEATTIAGDIAPAQPDAPAPNAYGAAVAAIEAREPVEKALANLDDAQVRALGKALRKTFSPTARRAAMIEKIAGVPRDEFVQAGLPALRQLAQQAEPAAAPAAEPVAKPKPQRRSPRAKPQKLEGRADSPVDATAEVLARQEPDPAAAERFAKIDEGFAQNRDRLAKAKFKKGETVSYMQSGQVKTGVIESIEKDQGMAMVGNSFVAVRRLFRPGEQAPETLSTATPEAAEVAVDAEAAESTDAPAQPEVPAVSTGDAQPDAETAPAATPADAPESEVAAAAAEAATSPENDLPVPTEAQKEAGNYKKGHIVLNGLDISIENPAGSKRREEWPALAHHYGYIKRTEGADGDHVDVFMSDDAGNAELPVFVVDQRNRDGGFDEHKAMLGFADEAAARAGYLANYTKGWRGLGAISSMSLDEFKTWLREGDTTKPVAYEAPSGEPATTASTPIDDFGETLVGARKHLAGEYARRLEDATSLDVAAEPLSRTWPEPEYQKLLDNGADPAVVAFVRAMRDEIPRKPVAKWKVGGWANKVRELRNFAQVLLTDGEVSKKLSERLASPEYSGKLGEVNGRAELYREVGHARSLQGVRFGRHHYAVYRGEKDVTRWTVEKDRAASAYSNWPHELAVGKTREEALDAFRAFLAKEAEAEAQAGAEASGAKMPRFDIYSRRRGEGFIIGVRLRGGDALDLRRFTDVKEARAFLADETNKATLAEEVRKLRDVPSVRGDLNAPRVGIDHRAGGDVTPEQFGEAFGFRGVQFGNYVEGPRRQQDLNNAYDALMDLAGVIGIPPRALSLNGTLGLAFGARGSGGKNPAMAHFEPGTIVINLTKGKGAGSLAHEWFHGLDNYFARQRGAPIGFATVEAKAGDAHRDVPMRPEMRAAFLRLVKAISDTGIKARSDALDKLRSKAYWGTKEEMAARSFESYVIAKLGEGGASNDYLANVVPEAAFSREGAYPYPTAAELPTIRAAFDDFFQTIETGPGQNGAVALFSQPAQATPSAGVDATELDTAVRAVVDKWEGDAPEVFVRATPNDLPDGVSDEPGAATAEGIYYRGRVYLVASNIESMDRAMKVLAHEAFGHYGVEAVVGEREWSAITRDIGAMMKRAGEQSDAMQAVLQSVRERYPKADPQTLAKEVIAVMAERGVQAGVLNRVLAAVRRLLRRFGLVERFNESDLRDIVGRGMRHVERGGPASRQPAGDLSPAMSQGLGELSRAFAKLAKLDGMFRYPTSTKSDLRGLLADYLPAADMRVVFERDAAVPVSDDEVAPARGYVIQMGENGGDATVYIEHGEQRRIVLDASNLKAGEAKGSALYMALFNFALNTDRVFVGDPSGLSDEALLRRTELMAAAAIKHQTTRMMAPHPRQVQPDVKWATPLRWTPGDDGANMESLLRTSYQNTLFFAPEIADGSFDFAVQDFRGAGGQPLTRDELERIAGRARKAFAGRPRQRGADAPGEAAFGRSTIARALLAHTLVRGAGETRPGMVDGAERGAGRGAGDVAPTSLEGVLYSQPDPDRVEKAFEASAKEPPLTERIRQAFEDATTGGIAGDLARKGTLYSITLRHIAELGRKLLPTLDDYVATVQQMATDRTQMQEAAGNTADKWDRLQRKDRRGADAMANLAHDATINGVDPDAEYQPLTFSTFETVNEDGRATERRVERQVNRRNIDAEVKAIQRRIRGKDEATKAKGKERIAELEQRLANEERRAASYPELLARWQALTPAWQEVYREARDGYTAQSKRYEDALIQKVEAMVADGKTRATYVAQIRQQFESQRLEGPYFPLARFGEFYVAAKTPGGDPVFSMYENKAEWMRAVKDFNARGYTDIKASEKIKDVRDGGGPTSGFMADLMDTLGKAGVNEDAKDAVYQLYLRSLPDLSIRKNFIHRKKTAGYSKDALRAFAGNLFHGSFQIARLRHAHHLENAIAAMEEREKALRSTNPEEAQRAATIINEMKERHKWVMNPQDSATANALTSLGFVWYLGVSPAAALVNLSQVPIVSYPVLAAKFGHAKAAAALLEGMRRAVRSVNGDITRGLDDEERRAFKVWYENGAIDKTMTHSLAGLSDSDTSQFSPVYRRTMEIVSWLFHKAEVVNREATALAAFRLARDSGMDFGAATKYANDAVWESQFDYSSANRARIMQGNFRKVVLMFRQYSLNMTWFLWRNAYQALKGESKEVQRDARRKLTGVLGMTTLFSGTLGLPLTSVAFGIAEAAAAAFGDDEEPFNAEEEFRNFLADYLGPEAGRLITGGPLEAVTGLEISSRTSLNDLWYRSPDRELEGDGAYYHWMETLAGPAGGIFKGLFFTGPSLIEKGHVWRGIEAMVPKFIRDGLRSIRYSSDGVQTMAGLPVIDDLTLAEQLAQFSGFGPSRLADRYDANNAARNYQDRLQDSRQRLLNAFATAAQVGDEESMRETLARIRKWNTEVPALAIDRRTIDRSLKARARYRGSAVSGVVLDRRIEALARAQGRFAESTP